MILATGPVIAEEGTQRPLRKLGVAPTASQWVRAKSLAELGGWIKLQNPAGSESQKIVISDNNLRQVARGGTVSFGSDAWRGEEAERPEGATKSRSERQDEWRENYAEQQEKVRKLQSELAEHDQWRARGRNPYSAPRRSGMSDRGQERRDEMARKLAEEQRNLANTRRRARGDGVYIR
jgi:hypothetical protein